MKTVEIYSSPLCGFCHAAKRLLASKGVSYSEIDVSRNSGQRQKMMQRSNGRHTVPQIFIGSMHVGGFDELSEMDLEGKLDPLLSS